MNHCLCAMPVTDLSRWCSVALTFRIIEKLQVENYRWDSKMPYSYYKYNMCCSVKPWAYHILSYHIICPYTISDQIDYPKLPPPLQKLNEDTMRWYDLASELRCLLLFWFGVTRTIGSNARGYCHWLRKPNSDPETHIRSMLPMVFAPLLEY